MKNTLKIDHAKQVTQSADFHRDDAISFSRRIQEHMKVLLHLGVSVFVFKYHFFRASGFEFSYLPVDILLVFIGGTARISVYHKILRVSKRLFGISLTESDGFRAVFAVFPALVFCQGKHLFLLPAP